jgi:ribulose bisphosphate carboxylase small subunit
MAEALAEAQAALAAAEGALEQAVPRTVQALVRDLRPPLRQLAGALETEGAAAEALAQGMAELAAAEATARAAVDQLSVLRAEVAAWVASRRNGERQPGELLKGTMEGLLRVRWSALARREERARAAARAPGRAAAELEAVRAERARLEQERRDLKALYAFEKLPEPAAPAATAAQRLERELDSGRVPGAEETEYSKFKKSQTNTVKELQAAGEEELLNEWRDALPERPRRFLRLLRREAAQPAAQPAADTAVERLLAALGSKLVPGEDASDYDRFRAGSQKLVRQLQAEGAAGQAALDAWQSELPPKQAGFLMRLRGEASAAKPEAGAATARAGAARGAAEELAFRLKRVQDDVQSPHENLWERALVQLVPAFLQGEEGVGGGALEFVEQLKPLGVTAQTWVRELRNVYDKYSKMYKDFSAGEIPPEVAWRLRWLQALFRNTP